MCHLERFPKYPITTKQSTSVTSVSKNPIMSKLSKLSKLSNLTNIFSKTANIPNINLPNSLEISSETHPNLQGRKFNKLLRSVLILIASLITIDDKINIQTILSESINPISSWLLVKYYNAKIVDKAFNDYLNSINTQPSDITYDMINNYMSNGARVKTIIELNEPVQRNAMNEFTNILGNTDISKRLNCSNIETIWNSRQREMNDNDNDKYIKP